MASNADDAPVVLAFTGASGAVYGQRLLDVLLRAGRQVHLTVSESFLQVAKLELGVELSIKQFDASRLTKAPLDQLTYWHFRDYSAGIASGSFLTSAMVVIPCSMSTLASLAHGISSNLIHRAADVHLKERRKLVVVPRETPIGLPGLKNLVQLAEAGAVILPAMPGFYHQPAGVDDLVNFIVARVCDQVGVSSDLIDRWGT